MQLIISQKGASLHIREGRYLIRTREQEQFVPVHQVKTIHLHPATKITHEVILTALDHQTDILFFDRKGFPAARIWGHQFGSISTIRKNQMAFAGTPDSVEWIRRMLLRKGDNQIALISLLAKLKSDENLPEYRASMDSLRHFARKIKELPIQADASEVFSTFRGLEGLLSRNYFQALARLLPVQYRFEKRSQHPGRDAFNGLLNYAYGLLYSHVESALIKAGIDPFLGIMHRDEYNRPVLVYDFIEPFRLWADYVVCYLLIHEVVQEDYFEIQEGRYWLSALGKRVLIQSFNDYLQEIVPLNGLQRSRVTHLELEAQQFAAYLKKFS